MEAIKEYGLILRPTTSAMQIASDFCYKSTLNCCLPIVFEVILAKSNTYGIESLLEIDWLHLKSYGDEQQLWSLTTMLNYSYSNGRYALEENPAVDGKKIELVPQGIFRTALTVSYDNKYTVGAQWSWTGEQFADATNATFSPDAVHGLIPAYQILDFYAKAQWKQLSAEINVNNALNATYFYAPCLWISRPVFFPVIQEM